MPSLIHTLLATGTYRVIEDGGGVIDSEGLFVTRNQTIIFRGTEAGLIDKFKPGKDNCPSGGGKMLCGGPQNIRLFEGTRDDPHWVAEIQWVGLHSAYHGENHLVYRVEDEFTQVETFFPKSAQRFTGGDPIYFGALTYVPKDNSGLDPITENFKRARILTYTPVKKVSGVIYNQGAAPLSPVHPDIMSILANGTLFRNPDLAMLRDWSSSANRVPDPLYTWAVKFMETASESSSAAIGKAGAWVPSSLTIKRHLSVGSLFAFTLDVPWEQRVTPG